MTVCAEWQVQGGRSRAGAGPGFLILIVGAGDLPVSRSKVGCRCNYAYIAAIWCKPGPSHHLPSPSDKCAFFKYVMQHNAACSASKYPTMLARTAQDKNRGTGLCNHRCRCARSYRAQLDRQTPVHVQGKGSNMQNIIANTTP